MRGVFACGLTAVLLTTSVTAADEPDPPESIEPTCAFSVGRLDDLRTVAGHLGDANGRPLQGDAIASLRQDLDTMAGTSDTPAALQLQIELLKAYVQGLSSLKTANLVARVGYAKGQTLLESRIYRGTHDSMNWFNSETEWRSTFAEAQKDLLRQIAADLSRLCPGSNESQ